jgi:hypothetical protein
MTEKLRFNNPTAKYQQNKTNEEVVEALEVLGLPSEWLYRHSSGANLHIFIAKLPDQERKNLMQRAVGYYLPQEFNDSLAGWVTKDPAKAKRNRYRSEQDCINERLHKILTDTLGQHALTEKPTDEERFIMDELLTILPEFKEESAQKLFTLVAQTRAEEAALADRKAENRQNRLLSLFKRRAKIVEIVSNASTPVGKAIQAKIEEAREAAKARREALNAAVNAKIEEFEI